MKIILSTRNSEKVKQIRPIIDHPAIEFYTLADANIEGSAKEGTISLAENASFKTMYAWRHAPWPEAWTMADDTGLFIKALGGEPGVITADWAGEEVKGAALEAYALQKVRQIPEYERAAYWVTVSAVREPNGNLNIYEGISPGRMIDEPRGELKPEFPYSRIFIPDEGDGRTWAQMSTQEQNAISHRGKAFRLAREFLLTRI